MRTVIAIMTILTASGLATWFSLESRRDQLVWDHFDVVKPGLLYRSGRLTPDQLKAAVARYQIRTVVSFLVPGPEVDAEAEWVRELGVDFLNLPMPGDGFGRADQFREVLEAVDDPDRRPVLVHCARGTCRTGAAVALYRYERDGWTVEDVGREMERQVYREGWLPGYVWNMVEQKPFEELYTPRFRYDENRKPSDTAAGAAHDHDHDHDHEPGHPHAHDSRGGPARPEAEPTHAQ